jgi:tetratricopeptide (TPR) repeat protein
MTFIRRVGGRYGILANRASEPEPLLRIGTCYEELGLPVIALGVYRALARSFPDQVARKVALPLARSALAARDVGLVRTTAAGHVRRSEQNLPHWLLLLAEAEIQDGKVQRAADLLRPLVEQRGPKGAELRAVVAFAKAISQLTLSSRDVDRLIKGFDAVKVPTARREHGRYGEALMILAELERRRGRELEARARYLVAQKILPAGGMRAEASYWIAALDRDLASASSRFELAASEEAGMWQRLAHFEAGMSSLRSFLHTWPNSASVGRATR